MKIIKQYLYSCYWLIGIVGIIALVIAATRENSTVLKLYISVGVALLSWMFFIQKQKLEEDKLFFEAFAQFNSRFSELLPFLNDIQNGHSNDSHMIEKYFDLCAEEYYYFKRGRLPDDVWRCWAKGIQFYIDSSDAVRVYRHSMDESSFNYGLTTEVVAEYAK